MGWVLDGHSEFDLNDAIAQFFPQLKRGDLLARVVGHFQRAGESDPAALRGFCIEAYREIYRRALDIGDLTTALKALARLQVASK